MASKYDKVNEQDLIEDDDGIRPEDSASNVSAPTSMTSSLARQLKNQRAAAAMKLKMIEEEAILEEMERNIEMTTVYDERELRRKRREAKIEADLVAARIKAEKEEIEARILAKKEELEDEESLKRLKAERRQESLQTERRKLEAKRVLQEAEEITNLVSQSMSRTSHKTSKSMSRTSRISQNQDDR